MLLRVWFARASKASLPPAAWSSQIPSQLSTEPVLDLASQRVTKNGAKLARSGASPFPSYAQVAKNWARIASSSALSLLKERNEKTSSSNGRNFVVLAIRSCTEIRHNMNSKEESTFVTRASWVYVKVPVYVYVLFL